MDRLEAMTILLRVADKGSFSAASRELGVPLATVSRKVNELETHLGTKLLVRTTRKVALTDAGATYVASARHILDEIDETERIALAVAQVNGCYYCLSAHSYLGLNLAKISPEEVALNRKGESGDAKANAAVRFAAKVVRERGHITEADIKAVRDAGFSDGQIVEILAVTAENIFTNLLNVVAETDIDFPVVRASNAA